MAKYNEQPLACVIVEAQLHDMAQVTNAFHSNTVVACYYTVFIILKIQGIQQKMNVTSLYSFSK